MRPMTQLSKMIEALHFVPFFSLATLVGSSTAKAVRFEELSLVLWEKERQTWQLSSVLSETKAHLQENQGFLFFFFSWEKTDCVSCGKFLEATAHRQPLGWSHKQDQTASCKALNIVKEKLLPSRSGSSPGRRRTRAACFTSVAS